MNGTIFPIQKNIRRRGHLLLALMGLVLAVSLVSAQGINFPVGSPTATSGAGNARTDADNFFLRNNVAGMTEIPLRDEERSNQGVTTRSRWRFSGELQLATYTYRRERPFAGLAQGITSETQLGTPGLASEVTYTNHNRKYALGFGTYSVFGFQSKLKDPPEVGLRATFFDTRVASNDFAAAASARVHRKLSLGGSFIFGRGFVDLARPNALAARGIVRQDRLDVAAIGAPGISVGLHYRPTARVSFGLNYKTRRSYDLSGDLKTFVIQIIPREEVIALNPQVTVNLKLPAVAEGGVAVQATRRCQLFADFRFYDYSATFQQLEVKDKQSRQPLTTLKLNAYDVRSFRTGGTFTVNNAVRLHGGFAYTSNGFPAAAISPGTMNTGGFDISGGIGLRMLGEAWLNIGVAGILGQERDILPTENPPFAGRYGGNGAMLGIGLRW